MKDVFDFESSSEDEILEAFYRKDHKLKPVKIESKARDDFELELPLIFQNEAKKINKINVLSKEIANDIAQKQHQLNIDYEKIKAEKDLLIQELNSSSGLKKYSDSTLIEQLIKSDRSRSDKLGIPRNYYCLSDCEYPNLGDHQSIPFVMLNMIQGNPNKAWSKIKDAKSFLYQELDTVLNPDRLIEFNEMINDKEFDLELEDFENLLRACGYQSSNKFLIKIDQFNNFLPIQLIRLSIIFSAYISKTKNYKTPVKHFISIISDFNANKRELPTLIYFIKTVFPKLFECPDLFDILSNEIFSIETKIYGDREIPFKKKDYELQANILALLNRSFSKNYHILQFLHKLNVKFVFDKHNYDIDDFDLLLIDKDSFSEDANTDFINTVYLTHYRYKLLPYITANPFDLSKSKQENYIHCQSLVKKVTSLKENLYNVIKGLGNSSTKAYLFSREDLIKSMTENYQDINNLCKTMDNKMEMIQQDTFYQ